MRSSGGGEGWRALPPPHAGAACAAVFPCSDHGHGHRHCRRFGRLLLMPVAAAAAAELAALVGVAAPGSHCPGAAPPSHTSRRPRPSGPTSPEGPWHGSPAGAVLTCACHAALPHLLYHGRGDKGRRTAAPSVKRCCGGRHLAHAGRRQREGWRPTPGVPRFRAETGPVRAGTGAGAGTRAKP